MSKPLFSRKLAEDPDFRGTVEALKGGTVPTWKAAGKKPAPFTEPAPEEPPAHGLLARFGNWLRKIFTGVDGFAEEQRRYRQSLSDWNDRLLEREREQSDYNKTAKDNAVFEDAYRLMSEGYRAEQEAALPAFREVRTEFREKAEEKLRKALNDPKPKNIVAACADVLADRYLSANADARSGGADIYRNRLDKLAEELTVTLSNLFARDKTAMNNVMEQLLIAESPKDREQGLLDILDGPVKAQLKKSAEAPRQEKEPERQENYEMNVPGRN